MIKRLWRCLLAGFRSFRIAWRKEWLGKHTDTFLLCWGRGETLDHEERVNTLEEYKERLRIRKRLSARGIGYINGAPKDMWP